MDVGSVLFGRTRQRILALMFTRPDESFYLREIVRRTGGGVGAVQRELQQLTASGILRKERDRYFSANQESPVFTPLKQLIIQTVGVVDRLRTSLASIKTEIAVAFVFGSFVRGDHHKDSDIDVMVIARTPGLSLDRLAAVLRQDQDILGREISSFLLPAAEFSAKWQAGNPFVKRIVPGQKIFLIGDQNELERLAKERLVETTQSGRGRNRRPVSGSRARST